MKEYHLFIIWEKAERMKQKIIDDIAKELEIIKIVDVSWDKNRFCDNLSRFYGQKLPSGAKKIQECGNGTFSIIIVCDSSPKYEKRKTTRGQETVNINIFDRKEKFRSWTWEKNIRNIKHPEYKGSRVHGTNNEAETRHDLTLLLGISIEDLIKNPGAIPDKWTRNISGLDGWNNLQEMFYVLNQSVNYVVLRNFDYLPNQFNTYEHGDIDLLTDNYKIMECIIGGKKVFKSKTRVHHKVKIGSQIVYFDYRYVGDGYYCKEWENHMIINRVYSPNGFFIPDKIDYNYSLLYHAYIHKSRIAEDYKKKLDILFGTNQLRHMELLIEYLEKYQYSITYPIDVSVYINENNCHLRRKLKSKLYTIISTIDRKVFGYKLGI